MTRIVLAILIYCNTGQLLAQNAADAYYDPAEMAKAREALKAEHGNQINALILGERLEYQPNEGDPMAVWEAQAWVGGDIQKLWFKTEGEYNTEEGQFDEAELQALYSRAVSPFWDLQIGIRHHFRPDPTLTYAVVGAHGLAPYWFELDGQVFFSDEGDVSARLEAEYEFRLTQKLKLQPRIELNGAFSDNESISMGSGLSTAEAGLRLRYDISRGFSPYVGVSWSQTFGKTEEFVRANGEDSNRTAWVAGIRFWF